jgi:hypothetical protein
VLGVGGRVGVLELLSVAVVTTTGLSSPILYPSGLKKQTQN